MKVLKTNASTIEKGINNNFEEFRNPSDKICNNYNQFIISKKCNVQQRISILGHFFVSWTAKRDIRRKNPFRYFTLNNRNFNKTEKEQLL